MAIADLDGDKAEAFAGELGGPAFKADVTEEERSSRRSGRRRGIRRAAAVRVMRGHRLGREVIGRNGPAQLQPFETVVRDQPDRQFNVLRCAAPR